LEHFNRTFIEYLEIRLNENPVHVISFHEQKSRSQKVGRNSALRQCSA
jgi:hypothetical protein